MVIDILFSSLHNEGRQWFSSKKKERKIIEDKVVVLILLLFRTHKRSHKVWSSITLIENHFSCPDHKMLMKTLGLHGGSETMEGARDSKKIITLIKKVIRT